MFGFGRGRFPFLIPLVVLAAIVGYSLIGSAGAAFGFVLLFPLKLLFFMFLFGMFFRFARGGAPWGGGGRRGSWDPPRAPTKEERERAEAQRQAREEVDRLFPDL